MIFTYNRLPRDCNSKHLQLGKMPEDRNGVASAAYHSIVLLHTNFFLPFFFFFLFTKCLCINYRDSFSAKGVSLLLSVSKRLKFRCGLALQVRRADFQRKTQKGLGAERDDGGGGSPASCNFSSLIQESCALRAARYPRRKNGSVLALRRTGLIKLITIIRKVELSRCYYRGIAIE